MMSLHKLTAGDGYTYLTRQVAAADSTERGRVALSDYYTEKGERPGAWLGAGLAGINGVDVGAVVSEAQMKALFGEGLHPDADELQKAAIAAGASVKEAIAASALGARFGKYNDEPSAFITEVTLAYRQWNQERGLGYDAPVPAAERSRIRSQVGRDTFTAQYGRAPLDDRELAGHIARSSRPARLAVAGYDLTFSPVKSVSTLWALAAPAESAKIEAAHQAAVTDTIAWLEREVAYTRVGAAGVRQVDVTGLVATSFTHRDSRAGDPDLHTHVAVSNKVQSTTEGKWLALDGAVLHRAVVAASERYNTRLEHEVTDRLGVTFAPSEVSKAEGKRVIREVVGIPQDLIKAWSKRRAQIDVVRKELARNFQADHGRPPTPKEAVELAQQATLATREAKHEPRSFADQRATWAAQAQDVLGGPKAVEAMLQAVTTTPKKDVREGEEREQELTDTQISDLAKRALYTVQLSRARFQWAHVYAEASRLARGLDLTADRLDTAVDAIVDSALSEQRSVAIIPPEFAELTTQEVTAAAAEHASDEEPAEAVAGAAPATATGGDSTGITPAPTVVEPVAELVREPLVLRRADGESVYVQAKSQLYTTTEILDAEAYLVETAREAGGRVVDETTLGLALLEQAANGVTLNPGQVQLVSEMATSGARLQLALAPAGSGKTTAMSVLSKAWTDSGGQVVGLAPSAAAAKELGDATGGQADTLARLTYSIRTGATMPDWGEQIGPDTLVLIDEAGMAGTLELAMATRYVTHRGGSVRLVGDDQQLAAIAAGGVLRDIAEEVGAVTLSELMRFSDPAEGAATLALRAGDPEALGFYLDRGRVHLADEATVADQVFQAWVADTQAGKSSLMLAYANEVVTDLNARARAHRLATLHPGQEGAEPTDTSDTDAGDEGGGEGGSKRRPRWWPRRNAADAEQEPDRDRTVVLVSGLEASAGDLVITRRNDRRLGITATDWVKNGDRFTVIAAHRGGELTVKHAATERTIVLPADYVAQNVDLGYACTFHGAQGATVDTSHCALTGGETRQLVYVGMSRGREGNHVYVATAGDGDEHAMIRPERIKPPTAGEAFAQVLAKDGSQRSASTEIRHQAEPTTRLARSAPRYVDALGVAATDLLGPEKVARLEAVAEQTLPGLTSDPAWEALRGQLALTALDGTDPSRALTEAINSRELTTARDRAAVLHWRVTGAHPGPAGPLPWIQGIPAQLRDHPTWGAYLAARVALVTTHLTETRQAARDLTPEAAPRWAHPILTDRGLLGDVMVWRAVTGITETNDQGSILGGPHPQVAARHHQDTLLDRVERLVARERAGTAGTLWRPVITRLTNLGPRVLADPYWAVLDRRLDLAAAAGFDVPTLLAEAAAQGPVPDEHPASALWYRLAPTLAPAAALAATTGSGATRLRPPWCDLLVAHLPETVALAVMTDPYWPALVAAVHTAGTKGVTPERVIPDAIALIGPDRIGQPGGVPLADLAIVLAWRIADLAGHPDHAGAAGQGEAPDEDDVFDAEAEAFLADLARDHDQAGQAEQTDPGLNVDGGDEDLVGRPIPTAPADLTALDDLGPARDEDAPPDPDEAPPEVGDPADPDAAAGTLAPREVAEDLQPTTAAERVLALNTAAMDFYAHQYTGSAAAAYVTGRLGTDLTTTATAAAATAAASQAAVSGPVDGSPAQGYAVAAAAEGRAAIGAGRFAVGYAPPGWTTLVDHLKTTDTIAATDEELVDAGLAAYSRRGTTIDLFRDRLIFGLHNNQQQLVGFVGRAAPNANTSADTTGLDGRRTPKYINTPDTAVFTKGTILFGASEAADLRAAGATFVRVEGPLDAIAITLAGNRTHIGVAPLGTALTDHQADQLAAPTPGGLIAATAHSGGSAGSRVLVATDNDPAGRKAAEADYWKLITRGADPRELLLPGANDPAELYQHDPQLLATMLELGEQAPSLAQSLIDTRITAWGADLDKQWTHARLGAARHCAAVIAALPPEQWDEQVTYTATRIGEDQPAAMVYTEVIAAAINYDFTVEHHPPAELDTAAARLNDLAARLEAATAANRQARADAVKTVADTVRRPAKQAQPDPGAATTATTAAAAAKAEKRRREEQRRRHDTRHDGPTTTRGPSQR